MDAAEIRSTRLPKMQISLVGPREEEGKIPVKEGVMMLSKGIEPQKYSSRDIRIERINNGMVDELWQLYYDSGFIYEGKKRYISPIISQINSTWEILFAPEAELFRGLAFYENGKLLGSASGVQIQEETWLFQHLASCAPPIKLVPAYVTLKLTEYFLENSNISYLQTYYRPENPWPSKLYSNFFDQYAIKEDLDFSTYHFLQKEISDVQFRFELVPHELIIEELQPNSTKDIATINHFFETNEKDLLVKAYGWNSPTLFATKTIESYKEIGLRKTRKIFLAKYRNEIVSFVVAEDSSPGINLSGLLSSFQIFNIRTSKNTSIVEGLLIDKVCKFYRDSGVATAILLSKRQNISPYINFGFKKTKEYVCFTSCRRAIKSFHSFIVNKFKRLRGNVR